MPCSLCGATGHNKTTCTVMLQETVDTCQALVDRILDSLHLAQAQLAKNKDRLAEVKALRTKKAGGNDDLGDLGPIDIKVDRAYVCTVCKGGMD